MTRTKFRFTEIQIQKLKSPTKRTRLHDTQMPGLVLDITPNGHKAFRVYKKVAGKTAPLSITLGDFPAIDLESARKLARKAMSDMADGINPNDTKRQFRAASITLLETYNAYKLSRELKPTTLRGYEQVMGCYFIDWHSKRLSDISEDDVYKKHLKVSELSKAQADLAMRTLRAIFNFARAEYKASDKRTLFPHNPVAVLSEKRAWNNVARKQTRLRPSELKPFLSAVNAIRLEAIKYRQDFTIAVCDFVEFMTYTGLRKTELLELKWCDVYIDDRLFWLERTKNNLALELPLTDKLISIIKRRADYKISEFVFGAENDKGRVIEPKKVIARINQTASVNFTLHDLRRTYCSIAESLGIGTYTLKRLLNHKTSRSDVTAGYTVLTAEELREPAERIAQKIEQYSGIQMTKPEQGSLASFKSLIQNMRKEERMELISQLIC